MYPRSHRTELHRGARERGISMVEIMVAMTISLVMTLGLLTVFSNTTRASDELARTNDLITDGRTAAQILSQDLSHAGFWGGFVPQHDDLTYEATPFDAANFIPNVCNTFNIWSANTRTSFLSIAARSYTALPSGTGCPTLTGLRAGTDMLIVNRLESCVAGAAGCDAVVAGRPYMQVSRCGSELSAQPVLATSNTIVLAATASSVDSAYVGTVIQTLSGAGAGQIRLITGYVGSTRTATVSPNWTVIPNNTTRYALPYALSTANFNLRQRDCATVAERRRLISRIYYIANVSVGGVSVPALVRSELDFVGGLLRYQPSVIMVEGVESLRVELGIDELSDAGTAVDSAAAIVWADPDTRDSPTNRGDGVPDRYTRCTVAAPCTPIELQNAVAARLHFLTRSRSTTRRYLDAKSYCLATPALDGTCPADGQIVAANDNYMRHASSSTVRIVNVSGRRETP